MNAIITTNGPGEVSTWVKPVVQALKQCYPTCTVSVFTTPCMFSGGAEKDVLESFPEIDAVYGTGTCIAFVLFGRKPATLNSHTKGFVLSLGGDPVYAQMIGKRLNYKTYAYCDRAAGCPKKELNYFVPSVKVKDRFKTKGTPADRIYITGCLAEDAVPGQRSRESIRRSAGIAEDKFVLNIFPGSRLKMLELSLPYLIRVVESLHMNKTIVFTLAPFIKPKQLEPILKKHFGTDWSIGSVSAEISALTVNSMQIMLYHGNQYDSMYMSDFALSFPGSSNMELKVCKIPALIILPLNYPDRIHLPGLPDYICRIPGVGSWLKKQFIFPYLLKKLKYVSPVNREANKVIFPEMAGFLEPCAVAEKLHLLIENNLDDIRNGLNSLPVEGKASERIVNRILNDLIEGVKW